MIRSVSFPKDANGIAARLLLTRKGQPTDEHLKLLSELTAKGYREFCLESEKLATQLHGKFGDAKFEVSLPNKAGEVLRGSLQEMAGRLGFGDLSDLLRDVNLLLTREELREEAAERDKLIIQAIDVLGDIDKTVNTLYGHMREWYSIHFPELDRLVSDHQQYFSLVSALGSRGNFSTEAIEATGLSAEEAERITQAARSSVGGSFDELDVQTLQNCVEKIGGLQEARERVAQYIDGLMDQVAPNIRAVVGGPVGARLISLAGGLKDLARMPASTLQVLGAEKALFRALHKRGKPPKHGVIFQYPEIRGAPRKLRGKIARALAGKLSIAARVDAMSGAFVGDKLSEDLRVRVTAIKSRSRQGDE
ncbi:MAG: C/D box methylation guide ribonucleoprotein complex aNOP56 subunit [Candidatus Hadarchaeota archaeon]|nr:C/D box methylation guide ribonucleoprotein complex aNOP56 subunit [Candidatus Hadarchaeota archaeon]